MAVNIFVFFFSSRRRHTRYIGDWSSDVCSSDLELHDRWGQPVIVENKPGSTIGPEYLAKSAPDGYTLMIISSTPLVTLPHLQKVPYDVLKDLVGVTQTTLLTYAFVVNPATGIASIQELIARAKKEPGGLNYASAGNGSGQHLYVELLKSAAGITLTHVPYKGAAPALQAVLSGEPPIMLDVTVAVIPHVKPEKLRALLVTGSAPLEQLPGAVPFDSMRSEEHTSELQSPMYL